MIGRAVAAAIALVIVAAGLPATQALAAPRPSTPELIAKDVRSERIPPARGHLYRAYAIGRYDKLPSAYRSSTPWDGTLLLRDLRLAAERMKDGPTRREIESILAASASCSSESGALANSTSTTHYYVEYGTIGGSLPLSSYLTSLETAWTTEVDSFGWAAPPVAPVPAPGSKYHVRIQPLSGGLYGFVSSGGTHAGFVGDNPNTAWNDVDAYASCMVLNNDYDPFPGSAQQALDATTGHEFNHSLQFGYGALSGAGDADDVFVEGGATWMEDEVFDASNDNYNYLWPDFTEGMGDYDDTFPYPYWITFRGLTERYGTGVAGGGEDVMQRFWELTSAGTAHNLGAMEAAVAAEGTTLGEAFHAYAIAVGFNRACSGLYVLPYCFEEAAGYLTGAGDLPPVHGSIASVGGSPLTRSVENDYALSWITLPTTGGEYTVTVQSNESEGGPGRLRATAVCDTGLLLRQHAFAVVTDGTSQVVPFDPAGCTRALLTVTNETKTADNPTNSGQRSYTVLTAVQTAEPPKTLTVGKAGAGTGTVTSSPAGIDCGATCSAQFAHGTSVTLTAAPAADATFTGWSGDCTGTGSCQVTMSEARSVTATFAAKPPTLTVTRAGTGTGTVTSDPAGIDCGSTCAAEFAPGTVVTLAATAAAGSSFAGWSGACTGATCQVTMTEARNVAATFTADPKGLDVSKDGSGTGTVTSSPAGIDCGAACSAQFAHGTLVALTATPAADATFTGWSGACTGTGTCQVTMSEARSVTATFAVKSTAATPPGTAPTAIIPPSIPGPFPLRDTTAPLFSLRTTRLRVTRSGRLRLPIGCSSGETAGCSGTVRLQLLPGKRAAAARKSFRIGAGATRSVKLKLNRSARRRLVRSKRLRLRAILVVTDAAGNARTVRRTLLIRLRR